jgi:hypothetical protein
MEKVLTDQGRDVIVWRIEIACQGSSVGRAQH